LIFTKSVKVNIDETNTIKKRIDKATNTTIIILLLFGLILKRAKNERTNKKKRIYAASSDNILNAINKYFAMPHGNIILFEKE